MYMRRAGGIYARHDKRFGKSFRRPYIERKFTETPKYKDEVVDMEIVSKEKSDIIIQNILRRIHEIQSKESRPDDEANGC